MIDNLVDQLTRDEGKRFKPYTDTVGKLTIGVGRNLTDVGLSDDEIDFLLEHDIDAAISGLQAHGYPMNQSNPRDAALIGMAFNLGLAGLLAFRIMLTAYKAGDYETAAVEMLRSKWATQVGDRAKRLSEQLRTGQWV